MSKVFQNDEASPVTVNLDIEILCGNRSVGTYVEGGTVALAIVGTSDAIGVTAISVVSSGLNEAICENIADYLNVNDPDLFSMLLNAMVGVASPEQRDTAYHADDDVDDDGEILILLDETLQDGENYQEFIEYLRPSLGDYLEENGYENICISISTTSEVDLIEENATVPFCIGLDFVYDIDDEERRRLKAGIKDSVIVPALEKFDLI